MSETYRYVKHKTEKQAYADAYTNGYENALSDVENTLDYINYQLAFIKQWEEDHK